MAETFHLFPTLPQELRLQIWSIILHEPRNTHIRRKSDWELGSGKDLLCLQPLTLPPALTQVCSESRREALKVYTRAFSYGLKPRYTYINFALDRLIIADWDFYANVPLDAYERGRIRKIIFTVEESDFFFLDLSFRVELARTMTGLVELKVVSRAWKLYPPDCNYVLSEEEVENHGGYEEGLVCPEILYIGEEEGFLKYGVLLIEEDEIY